MITVPFGHKNTPKILTQAERLPTDPDQILKREQWLSAHAIAASQRGDVAQRNLITSTRKQMEPAQ